MGTRTISLRDEAYERLRAAKQSPNESFSDVVMRAVWPDSPPSASEYLQLLRERTARYTSAQLDRIDEVTDADRPPDDKWRKG